MNPRILALAVTFALLSAALASGDMAEEWVVRYQGPGGGHDYGKAIAVDDSGNVYATGGCDGVTYSSDVATVKYDPAGTERWAATYDGPAGDTDSGSAIVFRGGYVYVTGNSTGTGTNRDYVTIKYTRGGTQEWVSRYNGPADGLDAANAIAVDDSGNVYVTGESDGGATGYDIATVKYKPDGQEQWVRRYNGFAGCADAASGIALDDQANVYIAGYSDSTRADRDCATIKYSRGGVFQWVARCNGTSDDDYDHSAVAVSPDGFPCVAAASWREASSEDYLIVRYTPGGTEDWKAWYDGVGGWDQPDGIAVDDSGCVYVTGGSSSDYATVKYGPNGVERWASRYAGPAGGFDAADAIALDEYANVYVTGESDQGATGRDLVTIKYWPGGTQKWIAVYESGANEGEVGWGIVVDAEGNVYVTGVDRPLGSNSDFVTMKYCQETPVEGAFFATPTQSGSVVLRWTVASLAGIEGFNVYRATSPDGPFVRVNEDPIAPSSPGEFEDAGVWPETAFWYELRAVVGGGSEDVVGSGLASVLTGGRLVLVLYPIRPSPFTVEAALTFDVPDAPGRVSLAIYNVRGQLVKTLADGSVERGRHETSWNGTDDRGLRVSGGVYFARLAAGGEARAEKVLLVR